MYKGFNEAGSRQSGLLGAVRRSHTFIAMPKTQAALTSFRLCPRIPGLLGFCFSRSSPGPATVFLQPPTDLRCAWTRCASSWLPGHGDPRATSSPFCLHSPENEQRTGRLHNQHGMVSLAQRFPGNDQGSKVSRKSCKERSVRGGSPEPGNQVPLLKPV